MNVQSQNAAGPATTTLVAPQSRASKVQRVVTKSGLEAWLVEDYAVPLVAVEFALEGGSSQDAIGKAGTATMLGALMDEGAGSLDAEAFHKALDDKAIEISFSADSDTFHGRLKTMTRNVDAAFALLKLAVNEPRFDTDAIERVRAQMEAGLRAEANDPDAMAAKAWRQAAFPDHPYGRASRGTMESVPAITRDDLVAMHRAIMQRTGLKIAVVGAIDRDRLAILLDDVFAGLPESGSLISVPQITLQGLGERKIIDVDVPQATIRFGLPGIALKDPDHIPAMVLNHILGGGIFSARLFREVREKRGLAYSVHSQLATYRHSSTFVGGTSTKNERAAESLSVIEDEISKLAADGPTAEELDKAQKYLIGSFALRFDTSTKIAGQLVRLQIEELPVTYLDERNGLVAAVALEDTHRAARRLFDGKKMLVAVAGRPVGM
ncbi:MAG: insulinase family protein [Beijerinckiaceae bacterium]|nr:insulinase family protein [Beijerinckiaceae bacterium]MDO9441166.1 pitrilysin family protein [Beijerinckiaceae bacterium]